jgi:hypothetical protein
MRKFSIWMALLTAGCGSGVSADKACTDLAAAYCTEVSNCAEPLITLGYGDVATCQARLKLSCLPSLMAPNTAATPDKDDSCATALMTASCDSLYGRTTPAACVPSAGKLANGNACGDDAQCMSTYCKKAANSVCGVCGDKSAAGGACALDADCQDKLKCVTMVCQPLVAVGGMCDANHPCAQPNVCKGNVCAVPQEAGQTCATTGVQDIFGDCNQTKGLECPPGTHVCAPLMFAAAGQPCGLINMAFVGCAAAGHCKLTGFMGTCLAPAADGAACDATNGPECTPPAQCVSGACKLPNPAACM